jgi:hypothetical protein
MPGPYQPSYSSVVGVDKRKPASYNSEASTSGNGLAEIKEVVMCRTLAALFVLSLVGPVTPAAFADDRSAALAIIERAVRAHGGAEALTRSQQCLRRIGGTMTLVGKELPFTADMVIALPGRYRASFDLTAQDQKFQMTVVLNGDKAWRSSAGTVLEATKDELDVMQGDAYAMWLATLVPLQSNDFELSALPDANLGGQPSAGVKVNRKDQPEVKLFFDKKSGLLVKLERRAREGGLSVNKEHVYSDHRSFDGVQLPARELQLTNGIKAVDISLKAVKLLPKVDDSAFGRP